MGGDMPAGRPRKEISEEDMEKLIGMVRIQCTAEEISNVFGVSIATLDRRVKEYGYANFDDLHKKHAGEGKSSLRRMQWKAAEEGNATMLVWLGKQILKQTDKMALSGADGESAVSVRIETVVTDATTKDRPD